MKKKIISFILVFTMVLTSSLYLVACNDGNGEETSGDSQTEVKTEPQDTDDPTNGGEKPPVESESQTDVTASETESQAPADTSSETESGATTESESASDTESDQVTEPETQPDPDSFVYENGDAVKDAGITWDDSEFAALDHKIDESKAVIKTAEEMLALLSNKDLMAEGEVYRVTEPLVLESNQKYYGNLAAIIAEGGIVIKNQDEIVIKELIVKGNITVSGSTGVTFFKLDLQGGAVGVTIDKYSEDIAFKNCKISASDTAVANSAKLTTVYKSYFSADKGFVSTADNVTIQDSQISAVSTGVSMGGAYCTVRNCLIELANDGVGVDVIEGSSNVLVTLNTVKDAQRSIRVTGGFNCVVLLNSAIRVIGQDNINLYVVENKLGGAIELENNKYLLCDANTFKKDSKAHPVINTSNTEINGDNLQDVNARIEYGANEEILPHTNKDLFLSMDRQQYVTDLSQIKSYSISNYMRAMAKSGSVVILPPGVYSTGITISLDGAHSNTTYYGFGAYIERADRDLTVSASGSVSQLGTVIRASGSKNLAFKGLTFGYAFQSSGQIHVLEKLDDNQLRVITNAGYIDDYSATNTEMFSSYDIAFHAGQLMPWTSMHGEYSFVKFPDGSYKDADGSMIIRINDRKLHSAIGVGDIFTCRLSGNNSSTLSFATCDGVLLKDCVLYGYSSALAIVASSRSAGVKLERVHNTAHSQPLIDEATYNKYLELEDIYNVDLEISIDEQNRYRGGLPRTGSVDATHITGAKEGVSATSCIFEQMCDDGSNQRGDSSRLAGIRDNGDGTTTVFIKGTISSQYFNRAVQAKTTSATPTQTLTPKQGDRIFAYASNGRVLFDTVALTDAKQTTTASQLSHMCHVDTRDNSTITPGSIDKNANGSYRGSYPVCVDGLCDVCGKVTHIDYNHDDKCDSCGATVHTDVDGDNVCDSTSCQITSSDSTPVICDRFYISCFVPANGEYRVTTSYLSGGSWKKLEYTTYVHELKIKTDDVNWEALEGYDLTDNDQTMDDKILVDNLSACSIGFTFDNVLIQNKTSRGVLTKTQDVTIKNCTFRSFLGTAVLMSVESSWGESTVSRNIVVTGCLFDDTGRHFQDEKKYTIHIQGLGSDSGKRIEVTEDSLPVREIRITGNKFINGNSFYSIHISAAQDIVIKDNVFEARPVDTAKKYAKAIYINGAMNISVSGNTYSEFAAGDVTKAIMALNYRGLTGSDIGDAFPKDNAAD